MFGEAAGFVLGFALVLTGVLLGKVRGWAMELQRKVTELEDRLQSAQDTADAALRAMDHDGSGASDAAIAQVATRISALEKQLAAQDMTILDTAEKVSNRLQDRLRKRREAEVPDGDHDEIVDPLESLMRARAFYNHQLPITQADGAPL